MSESRSNRRQLLVGHGVAFVRYETRYAYAAVVADVTVDPTSGEIRVTEITVAHDCGLIINPDGVRNQSEGNVIQGISRTLKETVTWDQHAVTSLDWESYPVIRFPEISTITIDLIDRLNEPSWGAGEIACAPSPPPLPTPSTTRRAADYGRCRTHQSECVRRCIPNRYRQLDFNVSHQRLEDVATERN